MQKIVLLLLSTALCCAGVENDLSQRIGNFAVEILYHTSRMLQEKQNFILAPFSIWNVLAIIAEGATGRTANEINHAIGLSKTCCSHNAFKNIAQWLKLNIDSVQLTKINIIFVDKNRQPLPDFQARAKEKYEMSVVSFDFSESVKTANKLNNVISNVTHGIINKIVDPEYFQNINMVASSAVYFKGQWSVPFNASSTEIMPFYNSENQHMGYVNMMYKRFTYPLKYFKELKARAIELPYGKENRISMFVMLPNPGVSLEHMLSNLMNMNLNKFFEEMRISKEDYSDDDVDCYIPRFKVETDLDLKVLLKNNFGIETMFDPRRATLPLIAREPLYVSSIFHKVHIEVTEQGTTAAGVTIAEFKSRSGVIPFNANRPFAYIIVEKVTNTIIFSGVYREPVLVWG